MRKPTEADRSELRADRLATTGKSNQPSVHGGIGGIGGIGGPVLSRPFALGRLSVVDKFRRITYHY